MAPRRKNSKPINQETVIGKRKVFGLYWRSRKLRADNTCFTGYAINTLLYQHVTLSTRYSINTLFYQHVTLSTRYSINTLFYQHVILSTCYSINTLFYQHVILSTRYSINTLLYQQVTLSTGWLPVMQSTHYTDNYLRLAATRPFKHWGNRLNPTLIIDWRPYQVLVCWGRVCLAYEP